MITRLRIFIQPHRIADVFGVRDRDLRALAFQPRWVSLPCRPRLLLLIPSPGPWGRLDVGWRSGVGAAPPSNQSHYPRWPDSQQEGEAALRITAHHSSTTARGVRGMQSDVAVLQTRRAPASHARRLRARAGPTRRPGRTYYDRNAPPNSQLVPPWSLLGSQRKQTKARPPAGSHLLQPPAPQISGIHTRARRRGRWRGYDESTGAQGQIVHRLSAILCYAPICSAYTLRSVWNQVVPVAAAGQPAAKGGCCGRADAAARRRAGGGGRRGLLYPSSSTTSSHSLSLSSVSSAPHVVGARTPTQPCLQLATLITTVCMYGRMSESSSSPLPADDKIADDKILMSPGQRPR